MQHERNVFYNEAFSIKKVVKRPNSIFIISHSYIFKTLFLTRISVTGDRNETLLTVITLSRLHIVTFLHIITIPFNQNNNK